MFKGDDMKTRLASPSRDGFFSENSASREELVFSWTLAMDQNHVIFSFKGPKEEVKKRVREATHEILNDARYEKNKNYPYSEGIQYDIYINQNLHSQLTNMFWYIGKITGDFSDENQLVRDFINKKILIIASNSEEISGLSLYRASKAAKERSYQQLILKGSKTEDKNLWTEEELQELENKYKSKVLESKKNNCHIM